MTVKALQVNLGTITYTTGWYTDRVTGQKYYFDADNNQWFLFSGGLLFPLETLWEDAKTVVSDAPILMNTDDRVKIDVFFNYMGPAKTVKLYGAVGFGRQGAGTGSDSGDFVEGAWATSSSFTVGPHDTAPVLYTKSLEVPIPFYVDLDLYWLNTPGRQLALYMKIVDGVGLVLGQTLSLLLRGAILVAGAEAAFSDLEITSFSKV